MQYEMSCGSPLHMSIPPASTERLLKIVRAKVLQGLLAYRVLAWFGVVMRFIGLSEGGILCTHPRFLCKFDRYHVSCQSRYMSAERCDCIPATP